MTHVTIERAKAQRIADAFEDLKKNHGMVYVEELVDINQALAEPILSAGPITPEMANWSEADKAKLVSVITQHAAPVQEPVAWMRQDGKRVTTAKDRKSYPDFETRYSIPLYTTPPAAQRPFVGLTDEEILAANYPDGEENEPTISAPNFELDCFAKQVEAKLRSKNNG
jgi:hypothetical protein